jgi:hypothetical protein
LIVVVVVVVVTGETAVDSRHDMSWSINSVGLDRYYCRLVLVRVVSNKVPSLMPVEASSAVVSDLTSAILLSFAISLILIGCLGLI